VSRRMSDALSQARTQGGHKELSPAASQETAVASFTDSEPARASEERLLADHTSDAERGGASMDAGVSLDRVPATAHPPPRVGPSGCLVLLGILGVTVGFVMIKLVERFDSSGISGLRFTWSFGIGILSCCPLACLVFAATKRRLPARADWGRGKDVWLGIAAGATWGVANMGIDVSIDAGVPLGTANSIFQASIVVSGAWGIFYGELEGKQPILLFVVASVIFLGGIFLLTFSAGSESLEASPPAAPPLALTAS
jgi:hypothetical protein